MGKEVVKYIPPEAKVVHVDFRRKVRIAPPTPQEVIFQQTTKFVADGIKLYGEMFLNNPFIKKD